ncbi:MAG TPA: DUF2330 domain-containing protein [Bacillota bacterium]|nr:DUF2330 domain-containing protein [Bacillota bacterium]
MCWVRLIRGVLAFFIFVCATMSVRADGMVVPEVFYPKVEIPNQQALIHFADGIEQLVIETAFLGEGTNFAWVVPLPAAPEVKPVSPGFFGALQPAFQPRLVHDVAPYYAGMLFLCGLLFLGWRAMKDEVSCVRDLPLCLVLAVGAGVLGKHWFWGVLAAGLVLYMRLFTRSTASLALVLLIGMAYVAILTVGPRSNGFGLVYTLGDAGSGMESVAGVDVLSVQRVGVFETTTLRGVTSGAVLEWFRKHGYRVPPSAEPALRHYLEHGWVFVASRVRRDLPQADLTALHPLRFTFATRTPVYPSRLTAIENKDCVMDLYVFGKRRASARYFRAVRCERVVNNSQPAQKRLVSGLRIADPEMTAVIGDATVGTKLSAKLSPKQMATDVEIKSGLFWRMGTYVYSYSGALTIALNIALPLGALGWLLLGASRGGWHVDETWIARWRWRLLAVSLGIGLVVFVFLPKVEIESRPAARTWEDARAS